MSLEKPESEKFQGLLTGVIPDEYQQKKKQAENKENQVGDIISDPKQGSGHKRILQDLGDDLADYAVRREDLFNPEYAEVLPFGGDHEKRQKTGHQKLRVHGQDADLEVTVDYGDRELSSAHMEQEYKLKSEKSQDLTLDKPLDLFPSPSPSPTPSPGGRR